MEIKTDIIIIGAGPAGCISALLLSEKFNVAIIEAKRIPRKKSCSGVLIKKSIEIVKKYFGEIPHSVMCSPQKTTGLNIINHKGDIMEFPDDGINILREKFDNWMLEIARRNGIQVLEESRIINAQLRNRKHFVSVRNKNDQATIVSNFIIACDGIHGTSRQLFNAPKQNKIITIQRFFRGHANFDSSKFYAYTSAEYSQYDAWINSKNGEIIIGSIGFEKKTATKYLDNFIDYLCRKEGFHLSKPLRQEIWALPFVLPNMNILFQHNNVFFAGEAANLLNPFGEGISPALMSGIAIAQSLLEINSNDIQDVLEIEKLYKQKMYEEVQYMKRQWNLLRKYSPDFFRNTLECYNKAKKKAINK